MFDKKEETTYLVIMERLATANAASWAPVFPNKETLKLFTDATKGISINGLIVNDQHTKIADLRDKLKQNQIAPLLISALERLVGNHLNTISDFATFKKGLALNALVYLDKPTAVDKVLTSYIQYPELVMVRLMELIQIKR